MRTAQQYAGLKQPEIQRRLHLPADQQFSRPESDHRRLDIAGERRGPSCKEPGKYVRASPDSFIHLNKL
ncbi:hypothetical protein [Reticulibacter mediterranei]|uniref:hypothetical protein n=1 Tax=Reticulibacter mediterranei TaxID=2778369 RepID=UPI001C68BCC8|nr:hypothetical protein [Reticulibacter mediterranei]